MVEVIQIDDLVDEIEDALVGYVEHVTQGITTAGYEAAKECRKSLKQTSPKQSGDYGKSWVISKKKGRPGEPTKYIVHNKKHYRLTHLLEKGHAKRGGGRTKAIPHIAPAEEAAVEKFERDVEAAIRGD